MADDDALDIRSGGVVAVDTESLRDAAARLRVAAGEGDGIRELLARASRALLYVGVWARPPEDEAADAAEHARRLAGDLDSMADTYEVAELAAAAEVAKTAGDQRLETMLRGRAAEILWQNPAALTRWAAATLEWRTRTAEALSRQYGPPLPPGTLPAVDILAAFAAGLVGLIGRGAVPRGSGPSGDAVPVTVTPVAAGRTTSPTSLVQVVDRIPAGDGRVRVERYTMNDGSRRFVAYVAGTVAGGPDDEAWDMESNVRLYSGGHGASYDALRAALADAGAHAGDSVDLVGHSQGAMDASLLALAGEYDVPLLVTFGDPIHADVADGTLSVAVRHADDPVSALSDGGFAAGVGADGSFVASRETAATALTGEGVLGQHALSTYRETAALLDRSPDPRMDGVRARLDALAGAASVEMTVYAASRDPLPTAGSRRRLSASAEGAG